ADQKHTFVGHQPGHGSGGPRPRGVLLSWPGPGGGHRHKPGRPRGLQRPRSRSAAGGGAGRGRRGAGGQDTHRHHPEDEPRRERDNTQHRRRRRGGAEGARGDTPGGDGFPVAGGGERVRGGSSPRLSQHGFLPRVLGPRRPGERGRDYGHGRRRRGLHLQGLQGVRRGPRRRAGDGTRARQEHPVATNLYAAGLLRSSDRPGGTGRESI
ncbi:MAG: Peptidase C60, sortase A and B, partial [uncultured Rubrobacteraceae bacterium]